MSQKQKLQNQSTHPRLTIKRNSKTLVSNYRKISSHVKGLKLIPMIKADAYGHGVGWVSRTLKDQKNLYGFGVATLEEGALVREKLRSNIKVIVFSGAAPWTEEKGQFCQKYRLTPVINSLEDWKRFVSGSWHQKIPYDLKFNTGMNRLGISFDALSTVSKKLRGFKKRELPKTILSHLAMGENPKHRLSQKQLSRFITLHDELAIDESIQFHLANSAAIWNANHWKLKKYTQIVRPGLSLYGIVPWQRARSLGIKPVMSFYAQVLKIDTLKPAEKVGYGGTFQNKSKWPKRIATLGIGYADGMHRLLSQKAEVYAKSKRLKVLGTISMDLCTIESPKGLKQGDWVEILGPHIDLWKQAGIAKTIPYELLTSLSSSALSRDRNRIDI